MTRSIRGTRRGAALLGGVAIATALLVSGCSAGQHAETAAKPPSVAGVNVDSADNSVAIRNLHVVYEGTQGYPAGGDAPLALNLYNRTDSAVTVRISATAVPDPASQPTLVWGTSVVFSDLTVPAPTPPAVAPSPSGTPSPSGSAEPGSSPTATATPAAPVAPPAPASRPAVIEIPARGTVVISGAGNELLQVEGLNAALTPGMSVNLTFEFNNGAPPLVVTAPTGVPLSPAPRATPAVNEGDAGH